MKTVIVDDVLFTQKDVDELFFSISIDNCLLLVGEEGVAIGELVVHVDNEKWDVLVEDVEEFDQEDYHFVYINNEVTYLSNLGVSMDY